MENNHDWTQDALRGSSDIGNLGNVCACAGCNLRTGSRSGGLSRSGCAEWRRANSRRQTGPRITRWRCRCECSKQRLCENERRPPFIPRAADAYSLGSLPFESQLRNLRLIAPAQTDRCRRSDPTQQACLMASCSGLGSGTLPLRRLTPRPTSCRGLRLRRNCRASSTTCRSPSEDSPRASPPRPPAGPAA